MDPPRFQAGFRGTILTLGRETDLYYYRARYYDPKQGRFISEDPIGFDVGVSFYAYVNNNPVNRKDPEGLQSVIIHGFRIGPRPKTCVDRVFDEESAAAQARGKGWKFAHCMAACRARTGCKVPATVVWGLGVASEARQVAQCKTPPWLGGDPGACASAWADSDFKVNEVGFSCPSSVSCYKQWNPFWNQDKGPTEYGPFLKGGRGE